MGVKTMGLLHRIKDENNPNAAPLDQFRSPSVRNMDEHPSDALAHTFNDVDRVYMKKSGQKPQIAIGDMDEHHLAELKDQNDESSDDDDDDVPNDNTTLLRGDTSKSVHFKDDY